MKSNNTASSNSNNHNNNTTILIDTREKHPFSFSPSVKTKTQALTVGDYSEERYIDQIAVERKELNDFVGSLLRLLKSFKDNKLQSFRVELNRMSCMNHKCIVVEGSMEDIQNRKYTSNVHPEVIFSAVSIIMTCWKIPVVFCSNRQIACKFTQDFILNAVINIESEIEFYSRNQKRVA